MKKLLSLLCCGLLITGCANGAPKDENINKVTLDVVVENKDENETIFDEEVTVDMSGKMLADFLEAADKLDVEMEDGEYGKTIISILGVKTEDWNKGPWWTFSSDTNENCKDGYCMVGASELEVKDGDKFTFTFSSSFE